LDFRRLEEASHINDPAIPIGRNEVVARHHFGAIPLIEGPYSQQFVRLRVDLFSLEKSATIVLLKCIPGTIASGQSIGAVIEGNPLRLGLMFFSAIEGLLSLSVEN
jgi:hypothetical protein